jgi:homoserine dehydrogenase
MNSKTLFKTSEYVDFLESEGASVSVNKNPNSSTIKRIQDLIDKKQSLFSFQKSFFN